MTIRTSAEGNTTLLGGPPERPRSRLLLAVIAVVVVATGLVVAANQLGGGDGDVATTATQEPSVSPAPAVTTPFDLQAATKAAVIDAYRKSMEEFVAVGSDVRARADDPRIAQHSTGTALMAKQQSLDKAKTQGWILRGDLTVHPMVIQLGPTSATLVDCNVDRLAVVEASSGRVIAPPSTDTGAAATIEMVLDGNTWKVNHFKDEKRTCVPPAA